MSSSNCCFLSCVQVSQETGKVVWYSHLFKNFPQLAVIRTVKGFCVVSETCFSGISLLSLWSSEKCDYWLHYITFVMWLLVLLPFLNPAYTSGSSWFTYCWSLAWRILSIILYLFEHSLELPFLGIGFKTDFFQSCGCCLVFQICWHVKCSTSAAASFTILSSSTAIPSPPLALFVVILPKTHLTLHSQMSVSRGVIIPSLLFWSLRAFLYRSSVYSFHLLISSASVRSLPFLFFIVPILAWNIPLSISNFLEAISSLSHSIVFLYFFLSFFFSFFWFKTVIGQKSRNDKIIARENMLVI